MTFESWNKSEIIHWTMNVILFLVMWQFTAVYLNGNVGFSRAPEEHIDHVKRVGRIFYDAGVTP